jgi:uncharacterized protein
MRSEILKLRKILQQKYLREPTGHDWYHLERVLRLSLKIAKSYSQADRFKIQLIALLHDVDDWKFAKTAKQNNAQKLLTNLKIEQVMAQSVLTDIEHISFKGSGKNVPGSLEGKIVQDADRIDALGAIGIARVFAYGGFRGRQIYNPQVKPKKVMPKKLAVKEATSLNHFYEKLLRLKDLMNTREGKKMARARHKYLENYLNQFLKEWEGKI